MFSISSINKNVLNYLYNCTTLFCKHLQTIGYIVNFNIFGLSNSSLGLIYLIMESKRQQKFAGVIQEDLAAIFQREGMTFLPNTLVTITKVRVTPDLALARVFLSFFNNTNTQVALQTIKLHASEIRYKLGARIKDQVRIIPQLEFFIDDTSEYVERMDKIFDKIHKEESSSDNE